MSLRTLVLTETGIFVNLTLSTPVIPRHSEFCKLKFYSGPIVMKILNIPTLCHPKIQINFLFQWFSFQWFTFHLLLCHLVILADLEVLKPRIQEKMELFVSSNLERFTCRYTTVKNKMCTRCDFDTLFLNSYNELGMILVLTFNCDILHWCQQSGSSGIGNIKWWQSQSDGSLLYEKCHCAYL